MKPTHPLGDALRRLAASFRDRVRSSAFRLSILVDVLHLMQAGQNDTDSGFSRIEAVVGAIQRHEGDEGWAERMEGELDWSADRIDAWAGACEGEELHASAKKAMELMYSDLKRTFIKARTPPR